MRFEPEKIEEAKRKEVLAEFYKAVTLIEDYKEAKLFFKDLLTAKETVMLARRLQVAMMLVDKFSYQEIHEILKVGMTTIADVQKWLNLGGVGYRKIIERLKKIESKKFKEKYEQNELRKRYASYYWPEKALKSLIKDIEKTKKRNSILRT